MARKFRIAAIGSLTVTALLVAFLGGAYYAAQQVQPYYEQALRIEPAALEQGSRELESRATALYSDVKQIGHWQALFTVEQINGWLATQLAADKGGELPANMRDPRIAIAPIFSRLASAPNRAVSKRLSLSMRRFCSLRTETWGFA